MKRIPCSGNPTSERNKPVANALALEAPIELYSLHLTASADTMKRFLSSESKRSALELVNLSGPNIFVSAILPDRLSLP